MKPMTTPCDATAPKDGIEALAQYAKQLDIHGVLIVSARCPKCHECHEFQLLSDTPDTEELMLFMLSQNYDWDDDGPEVTTDAQ